MAMTVEEARQALAEAEAKLASAGTTRERIAASREAAEARKNLQAANAAARAEAATAREEEAAAARAKAEAERPKTGAEMAKELKGVRPTLQSESGGPFGGYVDYKPMDEQGRQAIFGWNPATGKPYTDEESAAANAGYNPYAGAVGYEIDPRTGNLNVLLSSGNVMTTGATYKYSPKGYVVPSDAYMENFPGFGYDDYGRMINAQGELVTQADIDTYNSLVATDPEKAREFARGKGFVGTGSIISTTPSTVSNIPSTTKNVSTSAPSIDAIVADAVAKATAKSEALIAELRAQQLEQKITQRNKAKDKLTAMLASWNLQGLANWIDKQIMADVSEDTILLQLYDQPEYRTRFPGMNQLRNKGRTITEKEYMNIENAYTQTARFFDLPKGFYDSPDDFGRLIANEVSAKEYQDRLQIGQDLARSLNPAVKQQLVDFYGVGEGDLTAYVLDADRALPLIQKQAKAAQFVGLGRAAGFSLPSITSQQAEAIAGTEPYAKLTEAQLGQALGQAGQLRREQMRLSSIEGMTYNEQEALDAVLESNPQALLASQQRARREVARFSGRGGLTGASLRSETAI